MVSKPVLYLTALDSSRPSERVQSHKRSVPCHRIKCRLLEVHRMLRVRNILCVSTFHPRTCFFRRTSMTVSNLGHSPEIRHASNTVERCTTACYNSGYHLAGVKNGHECFCDNRFHNGQSIVPEDECNLPCAGNSSETCGGVEHMNVSLSSPPHELILSCSRGCFRSTITLVWTAIIRRLSSLAMRLPARPP